MEIVDLNRRCYIYKNDVELQKNIFFTVNLQFFYQRNWKIQILKKNYSCLWGAQKYFTISVITPEIHINFLKENFLRKENFRFDLQKDFNLNFRFVFLKKEILLPKKSSVFHYFLLPLIHFLFPYKLQSYVKRLKSVVR